MFKAVSGQFPDTNILPCVSSASFQTPIHSYHWSASRNIAMAIAVTGQFPDTYS